MGNDLGDAEIPRTGRVRNLDPRSATERLQEMILERCTPEPNTGCWLWLLSLSAAGYGKFYLSATGRRITAQRASYMAFKGNIPSGYQIDHLCRVRCCVNPAHLEAVTPRENTMRGETITRAQAEQTHCSRGHELEGANLYVWDGDGHRHCRACQSETSRAHYLRNRERIIQRTRENKAKRLERALSEGGGGR